MILCLHTASNATIEDLLDDPETIEEWLENDSDEADDQDPRFVMDLDKSWHAIHFLLSGSADECSGTAAFLLAGGTAIGDIDVGYGPARAFRPQEVAQIVELLNAVSPTELRNRFVPNALTKAEIYPTVIWERDADAWSYVEAYYDQLRSFMSDAARKTLGVVISLA